MAGADSQEHRARSPRRLDAANELAGRNGDLTNSRWRSRPRATSARPGPRPLGQHARSMARPDSSPPLRSPKPYAPAARPPLRLRAPRRRGRLPLHGDHPAGDARVRTRAVAGIAVTEGKQSRRTCARARLLGAGRVRHRTRLAVHVCDCDPRASCNAGLPRPTGGASRSHRVPARLRTPGRARDGYASGLRVGAGEDGALA